MTSEGEFWEYILLENADFLLRKKKAQGEAGVISIDELVQEALNHYSKTTGEGITDKTKELVYEYLHEKCIDNDLWKVKEGYVIPAYYLADIFLIKANELYSEEKRRYKSVLGKEELVEIVTNHLNNIIGETIDAKIITTLFNFLEKLCNEDNYFRKIQDKFIIFDKNGKERLEKIRSSG